MRQWGLGVVLAVALGLAGCVSNQVQPDLSVQAVAAILTKEDVTQAQVACAKAIPDARQTTTRTACVDAYLFASAREIYSRMGVLEPGPGPAPVAYPVAIGGCAENGTCYGDISAATGRPKTVRVGGYYRSDGTYVRGHYRSK